MSLATRIPGVFAGGDLITGPRTAVEAFAAGRRAALAIHCYLQGRALPEDLPPLASRSTDLVVDTTGVTPAPRQAMPDLSLTARPGPTGRRSGAGFHRRPRPGTRRTAVWPAPARSASRTAPFSSTMSRQFPYTEKELVRLLEERGETEPLIPYSCHFCGLCQAVCPKDLHAGLACLEFREVLVARGQGPLPPHKGIQNYVKWGTSPTFALSRPDPATGKAAGSFSRAAPWRATPPTWSRRLMPICASGCRIPASCSTAAAPPAISWGRQTCMLRIIRNVAAEMAKLGAGRTHRRLHPLPPDPDGVSPGVQDPHHL